MFILLRCVSIAACILYSLAGRNPDMDSVLSQLSNKVENLQTTSGLDAGIYESRIFIYVPPELAPHGAQTGRYDNNVFVTLWVATSLLEASMYSRLPLVTSQQLLAAISTFTKSHDRNAPGKSSVISFYPQTYDASADLWQNIPPNTGEGLPVVAEDKLRQYLKNEGWTETELLARVILQQTSLLGDTQLDFDSSFVNFGFGALLAEMNHTFPSSYSYWMETNPNLTSVTEALKEYAYRPFAINDPSNAIDPRSYYVMRHFLQEAEAENKDVSLVPTWTYNQRNAKMLYSQGKPVASTMNDVDIVVCANSIYGLTAAILSGILPVDTLDDPEIQMIYLNTTELLSYQIKNKFSGRLYLEMKSYVSVNQFYWFTSRTLALLERTSLRGGLPHPAMRAVHSTMKYVLRGHMTQELLSLARPSVTSDEIYFDGILGNVDTNTNVDDRLGTTAITVNALINTWTVYDSAKKTLSWITDTPPDVQRTVTAASRWLARHILGDQYKHDLVFFTVDSPAPDDSVYWYPTNRLEFLNGTSFSDDGDIPEEPFIGVVEGVIPEIQYQAMLKRKHFGLKTPEKFHGIKKSFYIYWSSDACSYAITLLALAQHNAIVNDH